MRRPHLGTRDIQAWTDGEARGWRALTIRRHLGSCADCRQQVARSLREQAVASRLLRTLPGPVSTADAWQRLTIRSGGAVLRHDARARTRWYAAGLGTGLVAAGVALVLLIGSSDARVGALTDPPPVTAPRQSDRLFVERLHGLLERGEAELLENRCCADRDGEGPADDGTLLIGFRTSATPIVVLYEDRDGSGSLTPGDIVRLVSRGSRQQAPASSLDRT